MKKSTIHKLIFVLVVFVIAVPLFTLPVSAAIVEETDTYVETVNDFIVKSSVTSVNYSFGTSYESILTDIDSKSFYDLSSDNIDVIERDINEGKYYEYVSYQYTDEDISSSSHGVFTYCFYYDAVILPWSPGDNFYTSVVLNSGFLQFYGVNAIIDNVRFSIRALDEPFVEETCLYTHLINSGFSSGEEVGSDRFYYYDGLRTVSNIKFGSDTAIDDPPISYALCVDFLFRPRNVQSSQAPSIGINTASNLYLLNYKKTVIVGPDEPGYIPDGSRPEFDTPYFSQGDVDYVNMVSAAEAQFRAALNKDNTFLEIKDFLSTGISGFQTAFFHIGDMLDYTTSNIPYLEFVLYFGLGIGCIAFVLGLGNAIIGPSAEPKPERPNREPGQRFARGITTNKGTGRVSDFEYNNR